ncbi:MAG: ABC transporter permease [Pseudomonadota bacterium]
MIFRLALASLGARAVTVAMTVLAIALSTALFLGVEKVRTGAKESFAGTIAGTDLIVGARTGAVQLLLYSVFRIGNPTNNITWESFQDIAARDDVAWAVPITLGDSHRQFRVMGTTPEFFERYRFRRDGRITLEEGTLNEDLFDAVIGADVARTLDYGVDTPLIIAHGIGSFSEHDNLPFRVSGVLARTGTPVDRTIIISLRGWEAIHVDWRNGAPIPGQSTPADRLRKMALPSAEITAALVGMESRLRIFQAQRDINTYREEPLLAILPGVALTELWGIVGLAERALLAVAGMVVVTALIGMMATLFASLAARRREMAIYRAMGAGPRTILLMLMLEAVVMALAGAALGLALLYAGLFALRPALDAAFGLWLPVGLPGAREWAMLGGVVLAGAIVSALPAVRAYRISLADGMQVRS